MEQTLFYVPHAFLAGPLVYLWIAIGIGVAARSIFKKGLSGELLNIVAIFGIGVVAIKFVLPELEVADVDPDHPDSELIVTGMAIRGYGLMMLLGIVAGMALAVYRSIQIGIDPEKIVSLCFYMIVGGIVGARAFFVLQYPENFSAVKDIIDMTKGGLVVYGSVIGALLVAAIYVGVTRVSFWKVADIIAPGMVLGLALGRIGCLLNGCCFGGACSIDAIGIQFPAGSPPYLRQLETGELLGVKTVKDQLGWRIEDVPGESRGKQLGLKSGDVITSVNWPPDQYIRAIKKGMEITSPERSTIQYSIAHRRAVGVAVFQLQQVVENKNLQLETASPLELLGIEGVYEKRDGLDRIDVTTVNRRSVARRLRFKPGDIIEWPDDQLKSILAEEIVQTSTILVYHTTSRLVVTPITDLPDRTIKVHPTQIYSAINAALLCVVLWFYYPFRRRDGELLALLIILYAVTRFLLEAIRTDEAGQFGTGITIGQWVSIVAVVGGFALLAWLRRPGAEPIEAMMTKEGRPGSQ